MKYARCSVLSLVGHNLKNRKSSKSVFDFTLSLPLNTCLFFTVKGKSTKAECFLYQLKRLPVLYLVAENGCSVAVFGFHGSTSAMSTVDSAAFSISLKANLFTLKLLAAIDSMSIPYGERPP